ncbi:MAG: hypothetical protein QOH67_1516 [Hyphomicrobiales bacterium]|jgi:hypothetical protein|nr:hypothetical protein [Hyphomicrobiales bacterium]
MSDEDFLKRWSRRKRDVAKAEQAPAPASEATAKAPESREADKAETPFDPASLPPIESITALSDVTAFLRDGVPAELTRAALRHVWTADPAIRDFVGLAENAWDFTDPNAMPGFGPLEATDEVRRMIARVVSEIGQAAQPDEPRAAGPRIEDAENSNHSNAIVKEPAAEIAPETGAPEEEEKQKSAQVLGSQVLLQSDRDYSAPQHGVTEAQEKPKQLSHRIHGGALPR